MKLLCQIIPGKEIASLKFSVSNQLYQNIKMAFMLIRKEYRYVANLIKILITLLMAPSRKRLCTTRTRVNDSMSFASQGEGLGSFCYVDFYCF